MIEAARPPLLGARLSLARECRLRRHGECPKCEKKFLMMGSKMPTGRLFGATLNWPISMNFNGLRRTRHR
jgi:hypothetical protein